MEEPLASVIVPVYKVEPFIRQCIDSILAQTFTDFELILVDDGSPDNCGTICDEYALKDNRIRVIHQVNRGVSAARNAALKISVGKYVLFCDADDVVSPNWAAYLVEGVEQFPEAIVACDCARFHTDAELQDWDADEIAQYERSSYYQLYKSGLSGFLWNKVFERERIENNYICFDESVSVAEDVLFNVKYIQKCKDIVFIPFKLYYYRQIETSATGRYRPNMFAEQLLSFSSRLPLLTPEQTIDHSNMWLYCFYQGMENTFDKRNSISFWKKLNYNQKVICSEEFQQCLSFANTEGENPVLLFFLRKKNYYAFWFFQRLAKLKHRLVGK